MAKSQQFTFAPSGFSEYSITIDDVVVTAGTIEGNAHARAAASDPQVAYRNIVTLTNSSNVQIAEDTTASGRIGAGDLEDGNPFIFSNLPNGTYTIKAFLLASTSNTVYASAQKVVTVGSGSGGGETDPRIDFLIDSVSNIQDWITDADSRFEVINSTLNDHTVAINELTANVQNFGDTTKRVDQFTLNAILQLGRHTDEHTETPFVVSALDEISTTNDLSDATLQAALTRPLLTAAPYTSTGTGNSWLDAIFAFFRGFGIGSTAAIAILLIAAYLIFFRGRK